MYMYLYSVGTLVWVLHQLVQDSYIETASPHILVHHLQNLNVWCEVGVPCVCVRERERERGREGERGREEERRREEGRGSDVDDQMKNTSLQEMKHNKTTSSTTYTQ